DYHLFRSLQNFLNGRIFKNTGLLKLTLGQLFNRKDKNFFEKRIKKLAEKWQMVNKSSIDSMCKYYYVFIETDLLKRHYL
ncbi:hypothetical protein WH47_01981, partial [Habropoda laboriosa]